VARFVCGCVATVRRCSAKATGYSAGFSVTFVSECWDGHRLEADMVALADALREDGPADSKVPPPAPARLPDIGGMKLTWHSGEARDRTEPGPSAPPAPRPPAPVRPTVAARPAPPRPPLAARPCITCGQPFVPHSIRKQLHCTDPACRKIRSAAREAERYRNPAWRVAHLAAARVRTKARANAR